NQPAIAPLGASKPNTEVFRLLAARMGFDEPCFRDGDEDLVDQALASEHPWLAGITRERLERERWVKLNLPAGPDGRFAPFAARGIADGDLVRVFNDRGECHLHARVIDRVRPGVAASPATWWASRFPGGKGINQLTPDRAADMGGGATFYTNLVQVERVCAGS